MARLSFDEAVRLAEQEKRNRNRPKPGDRNFVGPVPKKPKRKPPPIVIPSIDAGWRLPPVTPEPRRGRPRSVVFLPRPGDRDFVGPVPRTKHLPTKYQYTPIQDVILPPKPGSARDKAIKQYNQRLERERRDTAKRLKDLTKAERKKLLAIPDRPGGLSGFLNDITEGRGILGLATQGPIGLFARHDARNALFHGDLGHAALDAFKIGKYRPPSPLLRPREQQSAGFGGGGFMDWLGNVNKGINTLPSAFLDVGQVAATTLAHDVRNRRGLAGLATIGPIGVLANKKAREDLFSGKINEAIKEQLPDWAAPNSESSALSKQILLQTIDQTKRSFTDPSFWREDPVNAAFSAAIVLGPAARAVGIARTFAALKTVKGATAAERFKVAVAESFHPGVSGLQQGIRRQLPTGRTIESQPHTPFNFDKVQTPEMLDISSGRHPFGRALQRQYDLLTKKIDPEARGIGGMAAPRRARRLEARRTELGQRRIQRDVNRANRIAALYINEGLIKKARGLTGDSLRRGRDAAIVMALQAPGNLDSVEAVKYAINDTNDILERGTAYAPDGDLADLTVVQQGQEAFYDGEKVTVTATGMGGNGKPTVEAVKADGTKVSGPAANFHLSSGDERVRIPLADTQRARLEQRAQDLAAAWDELQNNPKQREKFEAAVEIQTQLGDLNEDFGHVIARSAVGSDEWRNFLEGGNVRRNLMARRWRKQGLRVGEDVADYSIEHPNRDKFVSEVTARMGDAAEPLVALADRMAQAAAERAGSFGRDFQAADWWDRLRDTTSGVYDSRKQIGDALYQEAGPRRGMVRTSLIKAEELGTPLHGSIIKRGDDGTAWSGLSDNGDGTFRAWNNHDGWVDAVPANNVNAGTFPGYDQPLRVGEKVVVQGTDNFRADQAGKIAGYHEHPERGPEFSVLLNDGSTVTRGRTDITVLRGGGEPIFYSKAQQVISDEKWPAKAGATEIISRLQKAGVKKEELFWTGIQEFAELYPAKSVPKEDLLNHLENSLNGLNLDEIVLRHDSSSHRTKWGGPDAAQGSYADGNLIIREPTSEHPYYELVMSMPDRPGEQYRGGHYDVPNMLYHIRFHEMQDLDGIESLLIDELQSDPHASGRDYGYSKTIPEEIKAEINHYNRRKNDIIRAQSEIHDGHNVRYSVEDQRKAWVNGQLAKQDEAFSQTVEGLPDDEARITAAQEQHPEQLSPHSHRYADMLRDTDWRDPAIMDAIEAENPGHHVLVKRMDRYTRLEELRNRVNTKINELESPYAGRVPNMPFQDNAWMDLAMKRLAAWAVDNGQKRIYWTRGHEHMVRYDKVEGLDLEGGGSNLNPDDYGGEFYDSFGSADETFGTAMLGPQTMQEPIEGMNLALLERGEAPSQPQLMRDIPPERDVIDPDHLEPDSQGNEYLIAPDGRWAKILDWNDADETFSVEYVPATIDPWNVKVHYNGYGDHSNNYQVTVTNRLGEEIIDTTLEDAAGPYGYQNFWEEVKDNLKREREYAVQAIERHKQAVKDATNDEGRANAEQHLGWAQQRLDRMDVRGPEMADMLQDVERTRDMTSEIDSSLQTEFNQDNWDEFVSEHGGGGGSGDFESIRDHPTGRDESKSHLYIYDTILPSRTGKLFKQFGAKPFYKERAYIGRYSTEGSGVISEEGELPAHGIEITPEMEQSLRESRQSLFQTPVDGGDVPKGALEFIKGTIADPERVALRLFDDADASTVIHELGHVGLYDLHPRDLRIIEDELQGGVRLQDWTRTEHERFARGFERFIMGEPTLNKNLIGPFKQLAEIMQQIYATVHDYFKDIPISPAVQDVFDRMVNPRSLDEARTYFPHRSAFDIQQSDVLGGVRLPAGGRTLGIPKEDRRAFPNRANAEVLWETGEMHHSTAALSTQLVRRGRFGETLRLRKQFFKEAHPIKADQGIPPGSYLVRDPEASLEKIPQRVTAATKLDEQSFRELTGDADVTDWREALKNIVMTPEELGDVGADMKNVRWIEPWKVESLVKNVFPSSPSDKGAATLGMANTLTRMSNIYLRPIRYLTGNVPANVVLMALTHPAALPKSMKYLGEAVRNAAGEFGKGPSDLHGSHPALYNAIRAESGDIMAGAGLPEFYTQANNAFQKGERKLNRWSAEISDRLGEIADQPFRVAVWQSWAKRYGYDTPKDWEHLLATRMSHDPGGNPMPQLSAEESRIRDEIAQRTREDMIDFNAMTPWERQHIGRFFYLWAFTRGFIKWPLTFAREYPERLAGVGLAASAIKDQQDETRPFPAEWLGSRDQSMLTRPDGTRLDFSSWNPISGGVDAWNAVSGLAHGNIRGLTDYLSPTLTAFGEAAFDPTNPGGWGNLGDTAIRTYVPAAAQEAITAITGHETAASKRVKGQGKSGLWGKIDSVLEADRFSQGRYSPSITKKRTQDWKDLTDDYTVSTAHYDADTVTKSYQAYWRYKEYEQRVKYGIAQREGRQGLNDHEKAILLARVAQEVYGDSDIASPEEIDKASKTDIKEFVDAMDWMFKPRSSVMSAATRRRNETAASRQAAGVQR